LLLYYYIPQTAEHQISYQTYTVAKKKTSDNDNFSKNRFITIRHRQFPNSQTSSVDLPQQNVKPSKAALWCVNTELLHTSHSAHTVRLDIGQWFLTWGPGTPWGSQTSILGVPNANLEYQQISPNIFASHSLRAFVYTLRTLSYLASHSSSVFSSFLFSLVYLFGRAAKLKLPYAFQENFSYLLIIRHIYYWFPILSGF